MSRGVFAFLLGTGGRGTGLGSAVLSAVDFRLGRGTGCVPVLRGPARSELPSGRSRYIATVQLMESTMTSGGQGCALIHAAVAL